MELSNGEAQNTEGRIDIGRIKAATEEDIERWKREDGIDDETLGPALPPVTAHAAGMGAAAPDPRRPRPNPAADH